MKNNANLKEICHVLRGTMSTCGDFGDRVGAPMLPTLCIMV